MTDAETLSFIWRDAWTPPDRRPPWKWAEQHVEEIPHSPSSGRFRISSSPWLREPMEEVANPRTNIISIMAPIQSGKTLWAEICSAWQLVNDPSPTMILHQKDGDAEYYWTNRLRPFYEKIKAVARLFHHDRFQTKKDSANFLNGAKFLFKGAWNKKNLQGHTLRNVWGDETWQWPAGHQVEVEARVDSFGFNSLCCFYSQAGEEDDDTDNRFKSTDQREWNYLCPECKETHPFEWSQVEWSPEAKRADGTYNFNLVRSSAIYKCKCGHEFEDSNRNRKRMNAKGVYVVGNPDAPKGNVGFHWNALCCKSWGVLAEIYLRAKGLARRGDMDTLKQFWQKRLAVSWEDNLEDFVLDIEPSSYDPREPWERGGILHRTGGIRLRAMPVNEADFEGDPEGLSAAKEAYRETMRGSVALRFLTVDVQQDHFWAVVREWAPDGSSRLCEWRGGREGDKALLSWDDLESMRKEWGVNPGLTFVDNGFDTSGVNMECAKRGWFALQGHARPTFVHRIWKKVSGGKKKKVPVDRYYSPTRRVPFSKSLIARVVYWSNLNIKDTLARLRSNQDESEGATWEVFDGVEKEYLKQLDSEQRVKQKNGVIRWSTIGRRSNHLWDCEAEQCVAASMLHLLGNGIELGIGASEEAEAESKAA